MTCTGVDASTSGRAIREPVTMTSSVDVPCACTAGMAPNTLMNNAQRTARATIDLSVIPSSDRVMRRVRERHPAGAQILDWSRAQVAIMRPTPGTRAVQAIIRDLIATRDGATYFAERVRGVSLRYELGGSHPLVGRSVPDFELSDGTMTGEQLRAAKGLLLDFDTRAPLRALASGWSDRIAYVAAEPRDRLGLRAVLVRPDGFVAWAGNGASDSEEAARAASRWFGAPGTG